MLCKIKITVKNVQNMAIYNISMLHAYQGPTRLLGSQEYMYSQYLHFGLCISKDMRIFNQYCSNFKTQVTWNYGETLFKYLKKVSVPKKEGGPPIEFNNDGSFKSVEIRIVNLQLDVEASKNAKKGVKKWEEIGVWQGTPKKEEKESSDQRRTFGKCV